MSASFERLAKGAAAKPLANIPRKLYYKIGEVCEITGLTAHVLRYWEKEFPQLCPKKTASGHRLYREKDIEATLLIKELLYERKFTIKGGQGVHAPRRREGRRTAFASRRMARPLARAPRRASRLVETAASSLTPAKPLCYKFASPWGRFSPIRSGRGAAW